MRIAMVADIHGHYPNIEPCDLLIVAGDMTDSLRYTYDESVGWYDKFFRAWLKSAPADEIVGVAGNHDFMYEREPQLMRDLDLPWRYLEDEGWEYRGYKIWGSPWQPRFGNWAFNADEDELERRFDWIPNDTDILITHGPPYGIGDKTFEGRRAGSKALRRRINQVRPELHVFGHIHPGRGIYHFNNGMQVNASYLLYEGPQEPIYRGLPDKY